MKEATMLFKYPGKHEMHGDKFDYIIVDAEDIPEYIEQGWSKSIHEAKNKEDDKAPTRLELEQKAKELNIKFNGRMSDKTLGSKIEEALNVMD